MSTSGWRQWKFSQWNEALFRHYFVAARSDSQVVSRLIVRAEDLNEAAGDPHSEPEEAQTAFLGAVRCEPEELRVRLSRAILNDDRWNKDVIPPFFAYLMLTCLAAASVEGETVKEGVFRKRLMLWLQHPEGTHYGLSGLPYLWRALRDWLDQQRAAGAPYRALRLPDPGWKTLIGYSLKLAFPSHRDAKKLVSLLVEADLGESPPVIEVMELVNSARAIFSRDLLEVFDKAQRAFRRGSVNRELDVFWSTARDAIAAAKDVERTAHHRVRYQLFLQETELSEAEPFLVADSAPFSERNGIFFEEIDVTTLTNRFLVRADGSKGISRLIRLLLLGALDVVLPDFARSPVRTAVRQGVILFRRSADGARELAISRPTEGRLRVLARRELADLLSGALSLGTRNRATQFEDWLDLGSLDATILSRLDANRPEALAGIRCLQATETGNQIRLAEGIPVAGGLLGMRGSLPKVRADGADGVALFASQSTTWGAGSEPLIVLQSVVDDPGTFEFAEQQDLDGQYTLVATRSGHAIANRSVAFHARVLAERYGEPSASTGWIVEAALSDTEAVTSTTRESIGRGESSAGPLHPRSASETRKGSTIEQRGRTRATAPPRHTGVDDDPRLDRFVEVASAVATARTGIPEADFLELLSTYVGSPGDDRLWDVARSWVEAGYFDVLTRRHWRGRVYFARPPRVAAISAGERNVVRLTGLAAFGLRKRAALLMQQRGAVEGRRGTMSEYAPALTSWEYAQASCAEDISALLGLGPVLTAVPTHRLVMPVAAVAAQPRDPPLHYEEGGVWDWNRGQFQFDTAPNGSPVMIRRFKRQDRPDCYVVEQASRTWWSYSRNWALLVGHTWASRTVFLASGGRHLIRAPLTGAYLPLPVARAVVLRSGVTPGPFAEDGVGMSYAYEFANGAERELVQRGLWGQEVSEDLSRQCRWLLAVTHEALRADHDAVTLPPELQRSLRGLRHVRGAVELANRRVPAEIVPHIWRLVQKSGA